VPTVTEALALATPVCWRAVIERAVTFTAGAVLDDDDDEGEDEAEDDVDGVTDGGLDVGGGAAEVTPAVGVDALAEGDAEGDPDSVVLADGDTESGEEPDAVGPTVVMATVSVVVVWPPPPPVATAV
jgi:hypothetical protein